MQQDVSESRSYKNEATLDGTTVDWAMMLRRRRGRAKFQLLAFAYFAKRLKIVKQLSFTFFEQGKIRSENFRDYALQESFTSYRTNDLA